MLGEGAVARDAPWGIRAPPRPYSEQENVAVRTLGQKWEMRAITPTGAGSLHGHRTKCPRVIAPCPGTPCHAVRPNGVGLESIELPLRAARVPAGAHQGAVRQLGSVRSRRPWVRRRVVADGSNRCYIRLQLRDEMGVRVKAAAVNSLALHRYVRSVPSSTDHEAIPQDASVRLRPTTKRRK